MGNLCLGTVQFGMKYGINNAIGRQPTHEESFEMLDYALNHGISTLDTARAYGEAELVLGEYFRSYKKNDNIKVISKLRPNVIEAAENDVYGRVRMELEDSLSRMCIDELDGYLLHTPEYIYNYKIIKSLVRLKEEGYIKNIGISIYDIKEGVAAIDTGVIDYIQLPYSILDQRGIKEEFIYDAKKAGIKIFVRSAFLQGLFLMNENEIPEHLKMAIPYLKQINDILKKFKADKISAILEFVKCEPAIDYLVFGVERKEQLVEDIDKYNNNSVPQECIKELKATISKVDKAIIFPSLWSNGRKAE